MKADEPGERMTTLDVALPSGVQAYAAVTLEVIGVRVHDQFCLAHRNWMDRDQLVTLRVVVDNLLEKTP